MTPRFTRDFYIPQGATKIERAECPNAVAYSSERYGKFIALGFSGKAQKPSFHYSFATAQKRDAYIAQFFDAQQRAVAAKQVRSEQKAAARAAGHKLAVGDVLRSSWGYDQTNIDYYEVVALVGKASVSIRPIAQETTETAYLQGKCVPVKGSYTGEAMTKRVSESGDSVRIESYASAYKIEPLKVDGKAVGYQPSHWTAYN